MTGNNDLFICLECNSGFKLNIVTFMPSFQLFCVPDTVNPCAGKPYTLGMNGSCVYSCPYKTYTNNKTMICEDCSKNCVFCIYDGEVGDICLGCESSYF